MMTVMKVKVNKISDCVDAGVGSKRREHEHINLFEKKMYTMVCVIDSTV